MKTFFSIIFYVMFFSLFTYAMLEFAPLTANKGFMTFLAWAPWMVALLFVGAFTMGNKKSK